MNEQALPSIELKLIHEILSKFPSIDEGILFCSRATATNRKGSDIDLAITGGEIMIEEFLAIRVLFDESHTPYIYDVIHQNPKDSSILQKHVTNVGKVIYRRKQENQS